MKSAHAGYDFFGKGSSRSQQDASAELAEQHAHRIVLWIKLNGN